MTRPLQIGERVVFVDSKGRRYLTTLREDAEFHTHTGFVAHRDVIGADEASVVRTGTGAKYTVLRPTLAEFVLKMPRGAQVIYPKDLGAILMAADIFPGARVLESGVGSGALSSTMLRAGAEIFGYELRADFAQKAQENAAAFLGDDAMSRFHVEVRDCYDGIDIRDVDRVVLDLPEPWRVIPHAVDALRSGGILCAYLPSVTQVVTLRRTLAEHGFSMAETFEVLHRGWKVEGQVARPDHRMVAHTGFLTTARFLGRDAIAPVALPENAGD